MLKKSPRTESDAVWDRKIGAALAFIRNRDAMQTQVVFAKRMGISRSHLANIESGRTPLSVSVGWNACRIFDMNPTWLCAAGNGGMNIFPMMSADKLKKIEAHLRAVWSAPLRDVWPSLAWFVEEGDAKAIKKDEAILDKRLPLTDDSGVKEIRSLPQLLIELRNLTKVRGSKVALANEMKVKRQAVDQWLSGATKPTAEMTFDLISWVEKQHKRTK
jgi:transcriptional regulator with XRE-family HTH domain